MKIKVKLMSFIILFVFTLETITAAASIDGKSKDARNTNAIYLMIGSRHSLVNGELKQMRGNGIDFRKASGNLLGKYDPGQAKT